MSESFKTNGGWCGMLHIMPIPITPSPFWLPPLHAVLAGLWLGCVLTEALFERALLPQGTSARLTLARLHRRVDLWVELPVLLATVGTGLWLALTTAAGGTWPLALWLKLAAGALAALANAVCVWIVLRRATAAERGDWASFEQLDHWQHRLGAVVLLGVLAALGLGIGRG